MDDLQQQLNKHNHDGNNSTKINQTVFISYDIPNDAAQAAKNYEDFFIATRPCTIIAISEIHLQAGNSTPSLQIERDTGTQTINGGGTDLLLTAFDLSAVANTVQRGKLKNIPMGMKEGDRLSMHVSGTLTNLKGVCVTVEIEFQ